MTAQAISVQRDWPLVSIVAAVAFALVASAAAQPAPFLAKDIGTIGKGSHPTDFVDVAGTLFFVADDGLHGRELWRSDGTLDGTRLVRDIRPGLVSSRPYALTPVGRTLYFVAFDDLDGRAELWRSDGSAAGTMPVAVLPPAASSAPSREIRLAAAGDTLVFRRGSQMWRTDGTEAGTALLVDFGAIADDDQLETLSTGDRAFFSARGELWASDGNPDHTVLLATSLRLSFAAADRQQVAVVGDQVVFVAVDDAHGAELWTTDGTPGGTQLLEDIIPGPDSLLPMFLTPIDGALVFGTWYGTERGLWRTDVTAHGAERIGAAPPIAPPVRRGDGLVFKTLTDTGGYDLWYTDGTSGGTRRVTFSSFGDIAALDDAVYYLAGVRGGCLLKRTEGSQATTSEVLRINGFREAPSETCSGSMRMAGPWLFFVAEDGRGEELWRSDGTAAGTQLVRDVRDGTIGAAAYDLIDFNGRLLLLADDDGFYGPELWVSDGTSSGTRRFVDPPLSSAWEIFAALGDRLLFRQSPSYPLLWVSDGTAAGTQPLTSFDVYTPPTMAGALAFFPAAEPLGELSVWRTDGTPAGTLRLRGVRPLSPHPIGIELGGRLLFLASDETRGVALWRSDGTVDGTMLVKDINPAPASATAHSLLVPWRDGAFFAADDGQHGLELWSTDGTGAGTRLVRDIDPGLASSGVDALTPTSGALFFIGTDGSTGRELWISDGSEAGTHPLADIDPGPEGAEPRELTPVNGVVVFAAFDPETGVELWRSDGTAAGTVLVADIKPGTGSSFPTAFHGVGDRVYFVAHDDRHGWEVWRTDGSRAGTGLVGDLAAGGASAFFTALGPDRRRIPAPGFADVDGTALFVADDGEHGRELWKGDAGGAALLADIAPGALSADPREPTVAGGHVFFTADNEATGREVWAVKRAEVGAQCVGDCMGSWRVDITDLITGVRIALGAVPVSICPAVDANGDTTVTVDELVSAVGNALRGCEVLGRAGPSPNPIESVTPLPARTPRPTRTPGSIGDCRRTGCHGEVCADHDVHLPDGYCFLAPEYYCLETASCERVGERCGFVVTAGQATHRCFAGLGYCVLDEDCNGGEVCAHEEDLRVDEHPVEVFGLCTPAATPR